MPGKIKDEPALFDKIALGATILSLALAMLLYIPATLSPWVIIGAAAVGLLLVGAALSRERGAHILVRIVCVLLPLAVIGFAVADFAHSGFFDKTPVNSAWLDAEGALSDYVAVLLQSVLLFLLPCLAVGAYRRRRTDVILLRIFSIATLVCALATVLFFIDIAPDVRTWLAPVVAHPVVRGIYCLSILAVIAASFAAWEKKIKEKTDTAPEESA